MDMAKLKAAMAEKKTKKPAEGTSVVEEKKPAEEVAEEIVQSGATAEIVTTPLKLLQGKTETDVYEFIRSIKQTRHEIPIIGASNSELFLAFPNINANSLRFAVWSLRKKQYLTDSGIRRRPPKGTATPQVVWIAAQGAEVV
jgi:hypothetical protein